MITSTTMLILIALAGNGCTTAEYLGSRFSYDGPGNKTYRPRHLILNF